MEEKLNAILNNPQMMQQILSMAQALGQSPPPPAEEPHVDRTEAPIPKLDPSVITALSGLSRQGGIDHDQQALLHALTPYLSHDRVSRLERAMRAAQMAKFASAFLGNGGLQLLSGR